MTAAQHSQQRVVVVTGGGGGIGAAIAEELGRQAAFVVTLDPLVSLDGSQRLPTPDDTTAGRITAAGGTARAASVSVTDRAAVEALFADLVEEFGRLDAVINVAGISRPTSFAGGLEDDWSAVLAVHLDGYLNVLGAALPIMSAAGRGHILGVTSGSGWRPADTGAYGCAKRAVASLTWQLGRAAPSGVVVNAMSPIAVTRMVTEALARAQGAGRPAPSGRASGGLSLGSMPKPEELGPFGAHLVGEDFTWCRGQVFFAGGAEVAVVDQPRLLEIVRTDELASFGPWLEAATARVLAPAEQAQRTTGGSNPRIAPITEESATGDGPSSAVRSCGLVTDRPEVAVAVTAALDARGVHCHPVEVPDPAGGFGAAADALAAAQELVGPLDAVVVAFGSTSSTAGSLPPWQQLLAEHDGIANQLRTDAAWARAVSDEAARGERAIRLVTLTDATTGGGRSRAQASAQLARAAQGGTDERVAAFAVSQETTAASDERTVGELVAHLVAGAETTGLSGAELVVGPGWIGLRSHPYPSGSITLGGPDIPEWLDAGLRSLVRGPADEVGDLAAAPAATEETR